MAIWLVIIVTTLYSFTSLLHFYTGNLPMGIVFFGYALANIGLIMIGG